MASSFSYFNCINEALSNIPKPAGETERRPARSKRRNTPRTRRLNKTPPGSQDLDDAQILSHQRPLKKRRKLRDLTGEKILELIDDNKVKLKLEKITKARFWKRYYQLRAQFYASEAWKKLRIQVIIRDKTCICGLKGKEVHHKKKLFTHPNLGLDRRNLVYLCLDCHNKEHKK